MIKLTIFNLILLLFIVLILIILKKKCRSIKSKNIVLIIIPIITILIHYSSFLFYHLFNGTGVEYLKSNPNLVLPIYPCNIVMWLALCLGLVKKETKLFEFLIDYIFWFGIVSTLVGMFANVDFIKNPTLKNFEVTKSIVAHATLLLNSLVLFIFGFVKIKLERNMLNIFISIVLMFVVGVYCNTLFKVLVSNDYAYNVNSMFIIHSPFEGLPYLKYPLISFVALIFYFIIFIICEIFIYDKNERWFNRLFKKANY